MGFDDGRMVLESPNGAYYSGQTVRGKLIFRQDKVKSFRGIYVKILGFCKVHWTTTETRRVNGKTSTYRKNHESYEEYVNIKVYLVGGESGDHQIQPGDYEYPFSFNLPASCPASYEGSYGHIRYEIKAVVDRAFKFDQEKKIAVRVMAPLDLNSNPYCREPIEMEFSASYCCCCFSSGSCDTVINAPMSGYCPGQKIPIEISCTNKGNVEISHIEIRIVKEVVFIATHHSGRRTQNDVIAEIKKGSVPGNTSRNWTIEMEVPALDIYNLSGCRYIDLDYKLEVTISPDGCHNNSDGSRKIIIGTTPLVGFQDNVPNPLQDQMPQQISAVTQQPLSSYPVASPYPCSPPYPTNTPYPISPNQHLPYPVTSPYPISNPPYPTNNLTQSPHPTGNIPYPIGTPSIVSNSPYSDNPPPYPGNNSPYPTAQPNVPYTPKQVGSTPETGSNAINRTLLKTGNIGFTVQGSSNVPYHSPEVFPSHPVSPVPVNPYIAASAPVLDSPDTEKKE
ncbi:arrestin domain-containing protein 17-like [Nymphalis io]|uniref:arrestin domain-containing protein 17-like n=1 Tax=Inachis io TaxID=171585 RepID=UPI0021691368|nr:arrestin domain-containing protein 17-like [Nymphalis io]XP_050350241.1 arrestin domain-containing protein 17-like [Nymphalis io]XP_050350242.1 arrestin domain-containing protein 17-like [Nymphalis io]XP_050350243.1 arrestin domain-containing protein 17-like [Nymphalis io]